MKLCMMTYTMWRQPAYFSLRGMLELTQKLGIEGIDFVTLNDTDPKELRAMANDFGITVAAHTFYADLNYPTAGERQAGVDAAKRGIEDAVTLGAPVGMIPTMGKGDQPREVSRRQFIAGLQEVIDFAQQAGVTLTVENFPGANSPFVIADDVLEAMRDVPGLGLTFDNGNVFTGGEDPAVSFTRCAPHVAHAHFKDWQLMPEGEGMHGLDGRWYSGALIGEGIVNQKSCLQAMKNAGYNGFINIEYEGNLYPPDDAVRKAVNYLRETIASLA